MKVKVEKETVDLVVMGGYYGKGSRRGVIASYLLGARQGEAIYPITKIGSGFNSTFL